jgi:hypothetical protein
MSEEKISEAEAVEALRRVVALAQQAVERLPALRAEANHSRGVDKAYKDGFIDAVEETASAIARAIAEADAA